MRMILRLGILFALFPAAGNAVDWKTLQRQGHVSDFAGAVDGSSKRQLEEYCDAVERAAGVRIDLVTLPSLGGEPRADVARTLASAWGNQGLLLLLATRDHISQLEVRAPAMSLVPRSVEAQMFWRMGPALRDEHYGDALMDAAETLGAAVSEARGVPAPAALPRTNPRSWTGRIPWASVLSGIVLAVILIVWVQRARRRDGQAFGGRHTWGSRGSGGFGGFDSADSFGGFGGDTHHARASGDW